MKQVKIDPEDIIAALEPDEYAGFCIGCGMQTDGVEPDARGYLCENCGKRLVYSAEELVIMGYLD